MIGATLVKPSRARLRNCRARLPWLAFVVLGFVGILLSTWAQAATTNYVVRGVLREIKLNERQLVIAHEDIPNFMEAMTMSFNAKADAILTNVAPGEKVTFQLHVA